MKCQSQVIILKKKDGKSNKRKPKIKIRIKSSEKVNIKPEIRVITDKDTDVFPITNATCPKCTNKEAYFWSSQTRAGDEAETRFFRCTK